MQYSTSYSATRCLSTEIKIIQFPGGFRLKLRLIVMPTNLEYRARERQRKRESRRQASEAEREKGRQRSTARDKKKKQRRHYFVGRNMNIKHFAATVTT